MYIKTLICKTVVALGIYSILYEYWVWAVSEWGFGVSFFWINLPICWRCITLVMWRSIWYHKHHRRWRWHIYWVRRVSQNTPSGFQLCHLTAPATPVSAPSWSICLFCWNSGKGVMLESEGFNTLDKLRYTAKSKSKRTWTVMRNCWLLVYESI